MPKLTSESERGILQKKAKEGSPMKKYIVKLSEQEYEELQQLISKKERVQHANY